MWYANKSYGYGVSWNWFSDVDCWLLSEMFLKVFQIIKSLSFFFPFRRARRHTEEDLHQVGQQAFEKGKTSTHVCTSMKGPLFDSWLRNNNLGHLNSRHIIDRPSILRPLNNHLLDRHFFPLISIIVAPVFAVHLFSPFLVRRKNVVNDGSNQQFKCDAVLVDFERHFSFHAFLFIFSECAQIKKRFFSF